MVTILECPSYPSLSTRFDSCPVSADQRELQSRLLMVRSTSSCSRAETMTFDKTRSWSKFSKKRAKCCGITRQQGSATSTFEHTRSFRCLTDLASLSLYRILHPSATSSFQLNAITLQT